MHTFHHPNHRRRLQLIWPCALAMLACLTGSEAPAQTVSATASGTVPKTQPVILLASAGVLETKPAAPNDQPPTYLRDIQPIFMGKCSRCHNEQARFVYNWLDYKTAFTDRWEIRRRIWDSWKGSYFKEAMPIDNSPEAQAITDEERLTIRNWVASGSPLGVTPPPGAPKSKPERIELGRKLFVSICAACHQPTGQGLPNLFPPLAGSDFLNADKNRAIKVVINGRQGEVVVNGMKFNNSMPSFPLTDQDIANVLTFVYNSFGNSGLEVNADEVKTLRSEPPDPVTGPPPPPSKYE